MDYDNNSDNKNNTFGKESILPDDIIMSIKTEPVGEPEVIIEQEESVVAKSTGSSQLDDLLKTFNLIEVKPYLTRAKITFESLKYLSKEDIKEAIAPIGLRASFREKLFIWRKREYGIADETLPKTIANKVVSWLQNQSSFEATSTSTSSFSPTANSCKLSKSLSLILEQSLKGRSLSNFYKNNGSLNDSLRLDLINIILEDISSHDGKLTSKDFSKIVDEIVENFPNEVREYYFIPRSGKTNPGGKLWDKYFNQNSKRARLSVKSKDNLLDYDSITQTDNTIRQIENQCLELETFHVQMIDECNKSSKGFVTDITTCEKKIDALRALMEQRLNHIQVQIDVIMEAQEEQNMLLRNFIDSQQDMRNKFPIKTSKSLKEINDEITPQNRKSYINTVKSLLKPNGIKKNLKYLLSVDIVNEYNIDGVHGKLCLKDLKNFYDVVIDSIEVTATTPPADQQLREAIRLAKKRYLKSKSVSRARV